MYDVSNGKQSGTVAGGIGFVSLSTTCIEAKNACLFPEVWSWKHFQWNFKTDLALLTALVSSP